MLCQVITSWQPVAYNFTKLLLKNGVYYPADDNGFIYYWLDNGKVYRYEPGESEGVDGTYTVTSSSPSDYYTNITTGNFTLEASS